MGTFVWGLILGIFTGVFLALLAIAVGFAAKRDDEFQDQWVGNAARSWKEATRAWRWTW